MSLSKFFRTCKWCNNVTHKSNFIVLDTVCRRCRGMDLNTNVESLRLVKNILNRTKKLEEHVNYLGEEMAKHKKELRNVNNALVSNNTKEKKDIFKF